MRITHSLIGLLCGALLLLAAGVHPAGSNTSSPANITLACPAGNDASGSSDLKHWHSPAAQNESDRVPDQCASCLDPQNRESKPCAVDRFLRSPACEGASCGDQQGAFRIFRQSDMRYALQRDLRYTNPERFPRAAGENCRFLLWSLDPVIGVEDRTALAQLNYWRLAFEASQQQVIPPFLPDRVGLVIQSALTRGQHQFHLHIGTITEPYRQAVRTLQRDPASVQAALINGYQMRVKYLPDRAGAGPLSGDDPLAVARSMLPDGESAMATHGILVARAPEGGGSFVFMAGGLERDELNYRQPFACQFR